MKIIESIGESSSFDESHAAENKVRNILRLARYTIGGALLAIYAIGVFGPWFGLTGTNHSVDAFAAIVGGGGTLAIILKSHLLPF
jgi:hypothetical protein